VDLKRLVVAGDSAGGNLAAVVAIMARNSGSFDIAAQVLVYPVVDYRGGTSSYDRYGEGYGVLETTTVNWFKERYILDPAQLEDWRASPAKAPSLSDLPPCLVITAECDVLHDEGEAYAAQLREAGGSAEHIDFKGMTHGFFGYLGLVDDAEAAHHAVAQFLGKQ
jgi:acetyl esterase